MAALTAQQELDALIEARQKLLLGKSAASITLGEKSMTYTRADLASIDARIEQLRRELGIHKPRKPMRVAF